MQTINYFNSIQEGSVKQEQCDRKVVLVIIAGGARGPFPPWEGELPKRAKANLQTTVT